MKNIAMAFTVFNFMIFGLSAQDISNAQLVVGKHYFSQRGLYYFIFQNGNLETYTKANKLIWTTKTVQLGGNRCLMQDDGDLVIYNNSTRVWNTQTNNYPTNYSIKGQKKLVMQDDGNLVLLECLQCTWAPIWSARTGKLTDSYIVPFINYHQSATDKCCTPVNEIAANYIILLPTKSDPNRSHITCVDISYQNSHTTKSIKVKIRYTGSTFDNDCNHYQNGQSYEIEKTLAPGEISTFFTNAGLVGAPEIVSTSFN